MVGVGGVIASLFIMLKEDIYVLIRIQILVAVATVMFMVMFMIDSSRCRSHSKLLATVLKAADGMSDQIVIYLLGAMQSVSFKNPLFPVWAVVLVSLRASLGYLSGYGLPDNEQRFTEVANVIKFLGVAMLSGSGFNKPLWSLWALMLLRSVYRFYAAEMAIKSLWHGRSSEFLTEFMRARTVEPEWSDRYDAMQMMVVYGESRQEIRISRPRYVLDLTVVDPRSLLTLDRMFEFCDSTFLGSNDNIARRCQDFSLAFALSRLLRCRLEDMPLDGETIFMAKRLFTSEISGSEINGVLHMDAKRAFGILELELAFVRDYFHTLYPMVFWSGFGSVSLSFLMCTATYSVAFWLATDIRNVYYQPPADGFMLEVNGKSVDVFITWVFMSFLMLKEAWEMVTYVLSNWTTLLFLCQYVQSHQLHEFTGHLMALLPGLLNLQTGEAWHGYMDQYDFLQSFSHKPFFLKVAHGVSLGMIPEKLDGKKSGKAIKVPKCVKAAILQALHRIDLNNTQLRSGSAERFERYSWACVELHTCSQVILVWHIATSLCEIKLAEEFDIDLTNPGFLRSAFSRLKTLCCYSTSEPNQLNKLQDELKTNYHAATSMSRYCAYLQVFVSELLPDSFGVPDLIFADALQDAHEQLRGCNSAKSRYDKLMAIADDAARNNNVDMRLGMNTVQQGATLAKDLIENDDTESRWEIIAGVWADLLVHLAPSWNAAHHKYHLESGGEFITLIWVLLSHCGIEKSSLWDNDEGSEINDQETSFETSNIQPVEKQPDEDGIGSDQDPDTGRFK